MHVFGCVLCFDQLQHFNLMSQIGKKKLCGYCIVDALTEYGHKTFFLNTSSS